MKTKAERYGKFHHQLSQEREALTQRLARVEEALQALAGLAEGGPARTRGRLPRAAAQPARRGAPRGKRARNAMSLREAVKKVLASGPLTKQEILAAVQKAGYKFTASNPMNSVNVVLYTKGQFAKRPGKRFAPAK
ncbi:MAG: hypothetical protein RJA22_172 [Verrucomicrobiota bacterium]